METLATWGAMVVEPGTKAGTRELPDEYLGIALLVPRSQSAGVPPTRRITCSASR